MTADQQPPAWSSAPAPAFPPPSPGSPEVDRRLLAQPMRQSPAAVIFFAFRMLRQMGTVQLGISLVLLITSRGPIVALFLVGGLVVWALAAVMGWWRYTFCVVGDELKVSKGLLSLERMTIPLERVQSVSFNQNLLHRILNLVAVDVDTAGSAGSEFSLDAIASETAQALQRLAAAARLAAPPVLPRPVGSAEIGLGDSWEPVGSPEREEVLVRRSPGELIRVGLSRWPLAGLVFAGPLAAVAFEVLDVFREEVDRYLPSEASVESFFAEVPLWQLVSVGLALLVIFMIVGWIFQVLQAILTEWDLTVTLSGHGLRREAGLISRNSTASRLRRVQEFEFAQGLLERWLRVFRVRYGIIGDSDLSVVGSDFDEVQRLKAVAFDPRSGPPAVADRRLSKAYLYRPIWYALWWVAGIEAVLFLATVEVEGFSWTPYLLAPLLAIPLVALVARALWSAKHWGVTSGRFISSWKLIGRRQVEMELVKVQMVTVRQSPFQWRRGLARVELVTPEGHHKLAMLAGDEAEYLRDLTLAVIESDHRPWM